MTILNKDAMLVSAAMTDAFGADAPSTEAGLEKEAGQTGIFIFSKADYDLYLKNAAGAWVKYGTISGARETLTVPWGDNTAVFFKCADATATMHVHRKEGNILYDSTPENDSDDQNTLLTNAGSAAQAAQNYTFPAADGAADQVLTTDGSGTVTWADGATGGGAGGFAGILDATDTLQLTEADNGRVIMVPLLTGDIMMSLPPAPSSHFKISLVWLKIDAANICSIRTADKDERLFGLIQRISVGGGASTGYDNSPTSYLGAAPNCFYGESGQENANRVSFRQAGMGSQVDLYWNGLYWFTKGTMCSNEGEGAEAKIQFYLDVF